MKNDKKIFILIETILAVLALIVALFMIEEWADTEVRKISVVVQDSDGSRWAAFKYGLEMAASDNDVEVFVVSTGGTLTAEEEKELLETEVENGADGIIVQPVPGSGEEGFLEKINKKVPVIQVESAGDAEGGASDLPVAEPDHYAVGQALAEELKKDFGGSLHGKTIGIFQREKGTEAAKRREAGAKDCIRRAGGEILWMVSGYTGKGGELALPAYPPVDIMLALDDSSLVQAGEAAADKQLHGAVVYGIENSVEAFYCLDNSYVECLVVPDEFNVGYQSLSAVVQKLDHAYRQEDRLLVSYTVVRRDTLFSEENQNILFSMSQ